jgi:hypothetical protein
MTLTGPAPLIARDFAGRPLVAPIGNPSKRIPYTRATTIGSTLDDSYNLRRWWQRMTALGLVARRDLITALAATPDEDTAAMMRIVDQATEAAGANIAAATGTALHAFCERLDRGLDLGHVPEEHQADLKAYAAAGAEVGWRIDAVEQFTVLDPFQIAGTADRVVTIDGHTYIADIKTGSSVDYPHAFAAQLAVYAHGLPYDIEHATRVPWPVVPDHDRALIIWLPQGQGRCEVKWLDIAAGWEAVKLAVRVREWRAKSDLLGPYAPVRDVDPKTASHPAYPLLMAAKTVDELTGIWWTYSGQWTDELTQVAAARKATLQPRTG